MIVKDNTPQVDANKKRRSRMTRSNAADNRKGTTMRPSLQRPKLSKLQYGTKFQFTDEIIPNGKQEGEGTEGHDCVP